MRHERLKKGAKTPFEGILLTPKAIARIISEYEQKINLLLLEIEKHEKMNAATQNSSRAVCDARLAEWRTKHEGCLTALEDQKKIYNNQLKQCHKPTPWYASPYFSFVVGNILAGGLCVAAEYAK